MAQGVDSRNPCKMNDPPPGPEKPYPFIELSPVHVSSFRHILSGKQNLNQDFCLSSRQGRGCQAANFLTASSTFMSMRKIYHLIKNLQSMRKEQ